MSVFWDHSLLVGLVKSSEALHTAAVRGTVFVSMAPAQLFPVKQDHSRMLTGNGSTNPAQRASLDQCQSWVTRTTPCSPRICNKGLDGVSFSCMYKLLSTTVGLTTSAISLAVSMTSQIKSCVMKSSCISSSAGTHRQGERNINMDVQTSVGLQAEREGTTTHMHQHQTVKETHRSIISRSKLLLQK
eukprot:3107613-Amphidinium_carterae.1